MERGLFKELPHMIMKVEKSQDLQLATWRPKTVNSIILVPRPAGQDPRRANVSGQERRQRKKKKMSQT